MKKKAVKAKTMKKVTKTKTKLKAAKDKFASKPTALAPIDPVQEGVVQVAQPATDMLKKVTDFIITDGPSAMQASEMLVQLKTIGNKLEVVRKALTKPLKDEAKRIEAQFRPSAEALEKADVMLRTKMLAFRQQQEKEAAEARKALIEKAEAAAASGDQNEALVLSQQAMSQDSGLTGKVNAADGSVGVRLIWDFEVEDLALVPPEYFVLDESRVRAAVRSGVRDIAGVRIFQKEQLAVSAAASAA